MNPLKAFLLRNRFQYGAFFALMVFSGYEAARAENNNGATDLRTDYAFLFLMTLNPDFAAAKYTIENEDSTDVHVNIGRLPLHFGLMGDSRRNLQLELAIAYEKTTQTVPTANSPGEYIDSEWNTYGVEMGLLYGQKLTPHISLIPNARVGVARMENSAVYYGTLADFFKTVFDGTLFNWKTNASVINLGLEAAYHWRLADRQSNIKGSIYHILVDSFNESNEAVKFSAQANMIAVNSEVIFPTGVFIDKKRLDLVLMLGVNNFFGENRRTLGYTTSYQLGIGSEFPLKWRQKQYGHIRLGGQVLGASNMRGWLFTVGFTPPLK